MSSSQLGTSRDEETLSAVTSRLKSLASASRSIRCSGSCAANLCSVACGRLDGFYEIGFGGCWDVAAGALIVEEAGGKVLDPAGGPFDVMARRVLAGTPKVADAIAAILSQAPLSKAEPPPPPPTKS
jgi:inositol-phosphate phosphatase/L-galactose 1-phosphate phosphatase